MAKNMICLVKILVTLNLFTLCSSFEPISVGIGAAVLGALGYNHKTVIDNTYCRFKECCIEKYIPFHVNGKLRADLDRHLFGQHIAQNTVIKALSNHYNNLETSKKPLVMSFHGTPGTGKNYVADFIAKAIYKNGVDSNYVHRYVGRLDFPVESNSWSYSVKLKDDIMNAIRSCPQSLFIFDEVDDMPQGVFDTITSLLDHHERIQGLDFRKAIFIFLVNSGGVEIANRLHEYYTNDKLRREDLKLNHFEEVLEMAAFNRDGGLKHAKPIESGLIDHYIPFLPLEKQHVIKCIEAEFQRIGFTLTTEKQDNLLKYVTFEKLFAKNGCKRITKKAEIFD